MFSQPNEIEGALERLGALMDEQRVEPLRLLVCGGAALNVLRLRERTTRDVDVIAVSKLDQNSAGSEFELVEEWPETFSALIDQVARDLNLPMTDSDGNPLPPDRKWLNLGPRLLFKQGLPEGIGQRAQRRTYGKRLDVYFADRQDLIAFKILAALTPNRSDVHQLDLFHLSPTEDEMRVALRWVTSRNLPSRFRTKNLSDILWSMDFAHLIPEFCS